MGTGRDVPSQDPPSSSGTEKPPKCLLKGIYFSTRISPTRPGVVQRDSPTHGEAEGFPSPSPWASPIGITDRGEPGCTGARQQMLTPVQVPSQKFASLVTLRVPGGWLGSSVPCPWPFPLHVTNRH